MRTIKRVIVIGGGLGGLSAAISLAQSGYSVSLYERNQHLGGKLNRLEENGFGFDLGPSILTMPFLFEKLFAGSGKNMADYVSIQRLSHQWRSFFPCGTHIDLYENLTDMQARNSSLNERDIQQYKSLLQYARRQYEATEIGYFRHGADNTREITRYNGLLGVIRGFDLFSTVHRAIEKRISDPQFRDMLSYFVKYVGSSPYDAPALLNMLVYMQHDQGLWYVPGGLHRLALALERLAREAGVSIHKGQRIVCIRKENRVIKEAVLEDGTILSADYYVSNMEVIPFYEQLLGEEEAYIRKLKRRYEPASSGLVMHLGVKKSYPQLAHHNFFFGAQLKQSMDSIFHRYELPEDPVIYLVNVNKTDPEQAPPGCENIKVLPHIPYIQDTPLEERDYAAFAERVLVKLERMGMKDLRANLVYKDVWTPEDIRRVYGSDRGAIYGTLSDRKKNKGFKHPKQSERYDNLYFVGGTVNPGAGMPMVVLSGQLVRDKIVQRDQARERA